ncbi:MAG: hypothetical protein ACTSR8_17460 [Promethearchaeota archaeon]
MDFKYDPIVQQEINAILHKIDSWKQLFSIHIEYYIDGWAIYLREKTLYSRLIVIFKSEVSYSIKSFEIHHQNLKKESYKELYHIKNITDLELLVRELRSIIYGKDLIKSVYDKYHEHFS